MITATTGNRNLPPKTIEEPARQLPLYGEYEVAVLGGGSAGIAAAVASARAGRRTLLIERYGFLGGMGTAAGVTNFCGGCMPTFLARCIAWCRASHPSCSRASIGSVGSTRR